MVRGKSTPTPIFLWLLCAAPWALYGAPQLDLPAACTLGEDCWIVNYLDVDPDPDTAADFRCGSQSYDGHKGTDIAIRDWVAMERGVDVLAAADGTVLRRRDGMDDRELSRAELQELLKENRACGNGVFLDHGGGWQTIYCHMKKGSIIVKPGDKVRTGQKLGQVGHTGFVEFPHIHIGVMHEDNAIDPFTGLGEQDGCNVMLATLWRQESRPGYEPFSIYAAGFRDGEPDFDLIRKDASAPESLPRNLAALTFWAGLFGVNQGDVIELEIRDPQGRVFARREIIQDKTRARQFYYVGKRTEGTTLVAGTYAGTVRLTRVPAAGETITRELVRRLTVK